MQRLVENPLAQDLLAGVFGEGDMIGADADTSASKLVFRKLERPVAEADDAGSES
jgi:hypothetical protein